MMATAASPVGVVDEDGYCPGLPGAPQIQCTRKLIPLANEVDQLKRDHTELDKDILEMNDVINSVNDRFAPCLSVGPSLTSQLAELTTIVTTQYQRLDTTAQQSTQAFDTGAHAVETLTVKIDNSSPLETQARKQDLNPGPGSLQAARPMNRWAACLCFLGIKPLQAEAPVNSQSQNTNIGPNIVAPKEEPFKLPNEGRDGAYVSFMSLKSSQATNQEPIQERGMGPRPSPMTMTLKQDNQVVKSRILINERTPGPSAILLLSDLITQFPGPAFPNALMNPWKMLSLEVGCYIDQKTPCFKLIAIFK
ncbi:hypothetical protein DSO57_1011572 [Entomophthora muscae]|uniref:Uncharacterized protein n=1 Tax=Entomophthora muscae TaxID=34485 RepID=A0ACC2SVB5_9FUNG|nr:hypothetical protein DSO57_1011572 [Entomophthora muscae]